MDSQPTDRRSLTSAVNGRLGGRRHTAQKYAPIIRATEKQLAEILRDDVPQALRDLVRGVVIQETSANGEPFTYSRAPDIRAIELVINRIMGKQHDDDAKATAVATVVNIIRNNSPELGV